jgi:tRNA(Leu) C34 or U34 (ribose-2'-O)-methylase TrmL
MMAHHSKENNNTHYCGVMIQNPLNGFNVGSALRACGCFGAAFMAVSGDRWKNRNSDFRPMDTEFARKRIPFFLGVPTLTPFIPHDCEVVILDRNNDSVSLPDFIHPRRSCYIYGPEDSCVDHSFVPDTVKKHYVHIPSDGSLNLASCVYMTLYDRRSKAKSFEVKDLSCPKCGGSHYKTFPELNEQREATYHCNMCGNEWQEIVA